MKKLLVAVSLLMSVPVCAEPEYGQAPSQVNVPWSIAKGLVKTAAGLVLLPVSAFTCIASIKGFLFSNKTEDQIRDAVRDGGARMLNISRTQDAVQKILQAKAYKYHYGVVSPSAFAGSIALLKGAYKDFKDIANS